MNQILDIALGILTSIGGYLDAGAIATTAQAGARFGTALLWAILLGTVSVIFLIEMSGRLAVVSKHTLRDAIHHRFGVGMSLGLLALGLVVNLLLLASEIGGVSMALQLISGVALRWWVLPVSFVVWAVLWFGSFGVIEKGVSFAGLITVAFLVGAWKVRPPAGELLRGLLPSLPSHDASNYWYIGVSIIGAIITPFLLFFYSSGVIEEKWTEKHLKTNVLVAAVGMLFGAAMAAAVLVIAARVLGPAGIRVDDYHQAALMLAPLWGWRGFVIFVLCLGVASFGAAIEVALGIAYELAQTFGWSWGKNKRARDEARFTLAYTLPIAVAALVMLTGIEPLKLTVFTMVLTCAVLPFVTFPFVILLNDPIYMGGHTNPRWVNYVVLGVVALSSLLAIVALPLQLLGG